jgi:Pel9A-like, right handed beta helix region
MRSSIFKNWLFGGCILVGLSCFGACSGPEAQQSNNNNPGMCTANTQSDPANCGRCGQACVVGQACVSGVCTLNCVAPQVACGGICADPASNSLHCGGCNMPCGAGQICQGSMCVTGSCAPGTSMCNGACVDTQTNTAACGASCTACLVGQSCTAGVCTGGSGAGGSTGAGGTTGSGASGGSDASGGTGGSNASGGTGGSDASGGTGGTGTTGDCRVWLATNGNDSNPGTEGSPVQTVLAAYELMCPKPPDGTANGAECLGPAPRSICVKPGTYPMNTVLEFKKTRMGTANNRLILQGDPNSAEKPVFDFESQPDLDCGENVDNLGGFTVNAHYVTIKKIEVANANDTCILVQGTQDLIENVVVHDCADAGIRISSSGMYTGSGTNNTILNCDSYNNDDPQCDGENADGFGIKEGTGTGNAFIGCRAWDNVDDGFDFFGWTSPVRLENSWAFDQCARTIRSGSDCNGFKLGGDGISAAHQLSALYAVGNSRNTGNGFTENSNPASMSCSGCASWGNKVNVDSIGGNISTSAVGNANVTNMKAASARNADGSLKAIGSL